MLLHFAMLRGGAPLAASDTTPDAFSFTDQTSVALSSTITSAAITVAGINAAATISVSGGSYDINSSGTFTTSPGTVNNGDTVRARHTSSGSNSTATNTIVTIGGVSDTFTSTTLAASGTLWVNDPFNYTSIANALSAGEWDSQNVNGPAGHDIASVTGPFGESMKAYHAYYDPPGSGEPDTNLQWTVPGYNANDYSTGLTRINVQSWEYRTNWQFAAEKMHRIFGRTPGGSVNIDLIPGCGDGAGTDGVCREINITGQGLGEDALWFNESFTWTGNGTNWMLFCWEVQLNTVGNSDGWIKLWVYNVAGTEVLYAEALNINIRDNPPGSTNQSYTISGVRCGGWESGTKPTSTEHRYVTYFKISDYFIGYPGN